MRAEASGGGLDTELIALLAGLKPAMRVTTAPAMEAETGSRYRAAGLAVVHAASLAFVDGGDAAVLYVARAEREARLARDAEALVLPARAAGARAPRIDAHREVGRRLGFPICCVDAFCARLERGVDRLRRDDPGGLAEDYVAARDAWVSAPDPRVNPLLFAAGHKLVSFYPCRYDCGTAVRYAQAVLDAVQRQRPDAARDLLDALSRAVTIAPAGERAIVTLATPWMIAGAHPPHSAARAASAADEAFAASLIGATVAPNGAVARGGDPPPWMIPFGSAVGVACPVRAG